jgi:cysteine desulfurase family protein (TIGR01976 family)
MISTERTLADRVRPSFPALQRSHAGRPAAYFDGPGGTQVPQAVADAVARYLLHQNANDGWAFATSRETDGVVSAVREQARTFLGAASTGEILFGANMTTLTFHLARAVGRILRPGDEVVVSDLDHHANVDPWVALERDYGAVVRRIPLRDGAPVLDLDAFDALLGPKTRLVAVGLSSNAFGTINPVAEIAARAHRAGALVVVDAVHAAAHAALDVRALGADLLAFSAYKVYGPHVGVAYVRDDVLERLDVPRLAPQAAYGSKRGESGTLNFEGIAGLGAALAFLADLGDAPEAPPRAQLERAMSALQAAEAPLFAALVDGLRALPHVRLYEPPAGTPRHTTLAFAVDGVDAERVARTLSDDFGIFVSHGNFYAATAVARVASDVAERGGVVRVGLAMYTTPDDVRRLVDALAGFGR